MSGRKRKGIAQDDDDSDMEEEVTQSTSKRRESGKVKNKIPADVMKSMVNDFVKMALSCQQARVPVKRETVYKEILETRGEGRSRQLAVFKQVLERAQRKLRMYFGMELVPFPAREIPLEAQKLEARSKSTKASQQASNIKKEKNVENQKEKEKEDAFALVCLLPSTYREVVCEPVSTKERTYMGYVTLIVSLIVFSGGTLNKMVLLEYLKRLNVPDQTSLGTIDNIFSQMRKNGYILTHVIQVGDTTRTILSLAPRAKVEFGNMEGMLGFYKETVGDEFSESQEEKLKIRFGQEFNSESK